MVQRSDLKFRLLVVVGAGVLLSILAMVSQLTLGAQSRIKQLLTWLNWPVNHAIAWYARAFHNGNTDQLIPQGMALWGIYWFLLGTAVALGGYGVWRYFGKRCV